MEFSKPYIFYFLLSLIIPLIIHLFNFKKKYVVNFSNISLLKMIKTDQSSQKNIKRLIILLVRLACMGLIITAFTIPYIKNETRETSNIGIYIDNSFSMSMKSEDEQSILKKAKNNAINIISKLNKDQKTMIITNDFDQNNQKWVSINEAIELIDSIKPYGYTKNINDIINRYNQIADTSVLSTLYLFSDFQKNLNENNFNIHKNLTIKIGQLKAKENQNISIDSCYLKSPIHNFGSIEKIRIVLTNHSNKKILTNIKLTINGQQKSHYQIEIDRQNSIAEDLTFINDDQNNIVKGKIEIEENDMSFDNAFYFSYEIFNKVNILNINDANSNYFIESAFSDSIFHVTTYNISQIQYSLMNEFDLIILDHIKNIDEGLSKALEKYILNGGNVLIFPNKNLDIISYNNLFKLINVDFIKKWKSEKRRISFINYDHAIFNGVFKKNNTKIQLPHINRYFEIEKNTKTRRFDILNFHKTPFLTQYKYQKGSTFICYTDLNLDNNFSLHALFLPCLYNMAILRTQDQPIYYFLKSGLLINYNDLNNDAIIAIKNNKGFELKPSIKRNNQNRLLDLKNNIKKSGHYNLLVDNEIKQILAFNYNRKESNMSFFNKKDISNFFSNNNYIFIPLNDNKISIDFKENTEKKKIYHTLIQIAVLMILIEIILLRVWKI